jgi:TonB-dependent SusC/RagA subfamily outer membrane receptor
MLNTTYRSGARAAAMLALSFLFAACHHGQSTASAPSTENRVNIGYGMQDEDEVTGAVQTVRSEEWEGTQARTVEELLQGRVAGVQVFRNAAGGISVRIRGTGSIMGNNEPLYVIDGMPVMAGRSGALVGINPHDIERIDVLKDAGSTAIYGSRGANGVILVTTKRAR